jgi:hypothetical protein
MRLNNFLKLKILRYYFFSKLKKKGKKLLMLLKKQRSIQVGLYFRKFKIKAKYLLYKTLHINFNKINMKSANSDYFHVLKDIKIRNDYFFNFNKIKKILSVFDLFSSNNILLVNNLVPVFLTKFQYNLYDKNFKFLKLKKYLNLKKQNLLYLQFNDNNNYNYYYFLNLYNNLKNKL